jgi:hypothetical protein
MPTFRGRISSMGCSWILKSVGKGYTHSSSLFKESVGGGRSSSATRSITGPEAFRLSRPKYVTAGGSAASPMIDGISDFEMPHAGLLKKNWQAVVRGFCSQGCDEKVVLHPRVSVLWSSAYLVELSGRIAPFELHFAWDGLCQDDSCDHLESCLSSVMEMP